jgi:deferrochelatase/peroxidase EfeB
VFVICRSSTSTRHRRSSTPTTIFGFRDRQSQPVMKGSGEEPTSSSGAAAEPGEFILGYPDEDGLVANLADEVLSRNGSSMAYRRREEHVVVFRACLHENSETPDDVELRTTKFMGHWPQWCAEGAGAGQG